LEDILVNNVKDRILLIGPLSKNGITGVSALFDLLVSKFEDLHLNYILIDLSLAGPVKKAGAFDIYRAVATLKLFGSYIKKVLSVDKAYIIIASSRFGFLRDALFIWPCRIFHRRIILHLHGGGYSDFYCNQPSWFQHIIGFTLSRADVIIILGESLRNQFDFVAGIENKIRVIPNGLPMGLVLEIMGSKSISHSSPMRLLYLSNMIKSKGYLDLLTACYILSKKYNMPIHCDYCGEFRSISNEPDSKPSQSARTEFIEQIQSLGLEDIVTYHGIVTGVEKQRFLKEASFLILPTFYPWEGQPICIIEAMAFFTPVIATKHRCIPELVLDGYNGFLVDKNAPDQIANIIVKIWNDPDLYNKLSENAGIHFRENYTQEAHITNMFSILLDSMK
jgi:glycosyltransferase involved in cell wall biosynthesis